MEKLEDFVKRFAIDVGCYYKKNQSNYSLKKYRSCERGHMGVFGWTGELKTRELFRISTYKCRANDTAIADADYEKLNMHYIPKGKDFHGKATGLVYQVKKGSRGGDYQKAVNALKVVSSNTR